MTHVPVGFWNPTITTGVDVAQTPESEPCVARAVECPLSTVTAICTGSPRVDRHYALDRASIASQIARFE